MKLFQTTKKWKDWWIHRKIDWKKDYLDTWNHPHRLLIGHILKSFEWISLFEIGCGSGANLMYIVKNFTGKQVGGIDVSPEAIKLASQVFKGALLKVGSAEDIMLSDKSTDVVLTDMCLIYIDPSKINKVIKEIKRIARNYVILCEFHSKSFYDRMKLRVNAGYYAYDYRKLLKNNGFEEMDFIKIPENLWPGGEPQKTFGYIILAKVPKYD